jgi:hypothetical protein
MRVRDDATLLSGLFGCANSICCLVSPGCCKVVWLYVCTRFRCVPKLGQLLQYATTLLTCVHGKFRRHYPLLLVVRVCHIAQMPLVSVNTRELVVVACAGGLQQANCRGIAAFCDVTCTYAWHRMDAGSI